MRIDLFEFVESVFRGFVYFFYNVIETLWTLARHPRRGPTRLYRTHLRTGRQQIGGLTFLFLLFFAIFGLVTSASEDEGLMAIVKRPPSLDAEAVWLPLLGAMITTVLIDSAARLWLWWRFPKRPRKRQMQLAVFEYSLTWPVLLAILVPMTMTYLADSVEDFTVFAWVAVPLSLIVPIAALRPAAGALMLRGGAGKREGLARAGYSLLRVLLQVGLFLLVLAAALTGTVVTIAIYDKTEQEKSAQSVPSDVLVPIALRCVIAGDRPHVDVALSNPTKQPLVLDPDRDLALVLGAPGLWESSDRLGELSVTGPGGKDAPPLLFRPGETQIVRLDLPPVDIRVLARYNQCRIETRSYGAPYIERFEPQPVEPPDSR